LRGEGPRPEGSILAALSCLRQTRRGEEDWAEFRELEEGLRAGVSPLRVAGLEGAAKAFVLAGLFARLHRPALILTWNSQEAARLYDDLAAFLAEEGPHPREGLLLFPSLDTLLYEDIAPDRELLRERLKGLWRLARGEKVILITTTEGAFGQTLPREQLLSSTLEIRKGELLSRQSLAEFLVRAGYEREELVEEPGEFSLRGGVVDIWPSTLDSPARIEQFGEQIESLRGFDPATQRSRGMLESLVILPARELLFASEETARACVSIAAALEKQVEQLEEQGASGEASLLTEKVREDLMALSQGAYRRGLEYYLPYLWPQQTLLADYFLPDSLVILDEPERTEENYGRFLTEVEEAYQRRLRSGLALVLPRGHYVSFGEGEERLSRHRRLEISLLGQGGLGREVRLESGPAEDFAANLNLLVNGVREAQQRGFLVVAATRQAQRLEELLREAGLRRVRRIDTPHLIPPPQGGRKPLESPGIPRSADETLVLSGGTADEAQTVPSPLMGEGEGGGDYRPGDIVIISASLSRGFRLRGANLILFTDGELFGWKRPPRPGPRRKETISITALSQLKEGDYVVHIHHGIGIYGGLVRQAVEEAEREYLLIKYAGRDRLYVPADQFDRVQKYLGGEAEPPPLNRLGGREWERATRRARRSARELAKELVELYAARSKQEGFAFSPDTPWQEEMEAGFPYEETEDQRQALVEIKQDMEKPVPMERLVCGDVGFGKTEVAIRAAFKAVMDSKQVAVLVPTTVLAAQHFNTFRERLAPYPMRVEMLSRFRSPKEQKRILAELAAGSVDVVVGTHRLLSRDVRFKDLGLLIIDEEQRFGVRHKERLKQLRASVDALTLTATPIPRTLHMALSGLREMSLINDPPEGRRPIRTQASQRADALIVEAIQRELERRGQVYYVHNRVESIPHVAAHLQRLLPEARIVVAHGQMPEEALERVMMDFYAGKHDLLVCTTIIENGLDLPNVNTIVVEQTDRLGLAQLYQLRGRVGRSDRQAYAYLMWTPHKRMSEAAQQRLQAIKEFCDLGSGLKLALRDLEIRGAGNLLGPEQHGFVAAVGFDLYCQLLAEAVNEARGQPLQPRPEVSLDLPVDAFLPDDWVPSLNQRIELYRRLAAVPNEEMLEDLIAEMKDRFGASTGSASPLEGHIAPPRAKPRGGAPLPGPVNNLVRMVRIKLLCMANRVQRIAAKKGLLIFELAGPPLSATLMRDLRAALALEGPCSREARVEPVRVVLPFRKTTPEDLFLLVEQTLGVIGLLPAPEEKAAAVL